MATGVPILAFDLAPASFRATPEILAQYGALTGAEDARLAPRVAMAIEDALDRAGWPVGRVCGPETALADNFDVSVRVLRQALRILEARGACRLRRGPSGGLIVLAPDQAAIAAAMANHLLWTGVRDAEVWEARALIEPLALAAAAQASDRGQAAAAPPFLGLALACLERFGGGLSSAPKDLSRALDAAMRAGDADRAFDLARESVRIRRGSGLAVVSESAPSFPGATVGQNLAARVAARIGAEIRPDACRDGEPLGTVWTLSERYGVSPGVMVEAVRLLEDAGVAKSVKGRGGGVRLRQPDPASIITTVHGYLAAHAAMPEAEVCFHLNAWATEQAARTRSNAQMDDLGRLWGLVEAAPEPVRAQAWFALQRRLYEIADNGPLHLLAVCFAGFTVRAQASAPASDPALAGKIREAGWAIVRGVAERDAVLASAGHERARAIFIPGPRRLMRA
ncbi:GntR family transcriptional regulator [Caulobacter hibisci]|uniref:GntR family transcriptional regulator n=1 Tax=Caulobacter hibisci TaxID=2035993 RepID=A0ABS0T789_9CAUL|nr:GntR family transcriptional regulator [Caulobacter hibisci]MBI1686758.1 GntR family transcriptional regulator [Caulobacter hibisci]